MFRLQAFRADPAGEIGNLSRAKRIELQTLAHEYQLDVPHGANKNELHNLLLDHLLEEGKIDSETHETYSIADKPDLATMKLKLELAKIEREQQREAAAIRKEEKEREAAIRKEEKEREAALAKEALQLRKEEAALRKEEQEREIALKERETAILRERERVQLEAKHRHLEMQREHDKQQAAMAMEYRQQEFALETTHLTQRQQATASLSVSFNISHESKLMSPFVETEVDVFFTTFETLANQLSWPADQWATLLRVHLTGRAAVTLSTLVSENDYQTLKQAVLNAYLLSTESYRRKFRDHLKASTTTFLEFANTKRRYFMKWLEAAHVSTFAELVNLMLVEEFLRRVPPPVRLYLADKEETDYLRCAKSADTYSLIHRLTPEQPSSKKSWYSYEKVSTDQAGSQLYCKYCRLYGHTIDKCGKSQYKGNTESTKPKQTPPKSGKPVMNVGVHVNDLSLFSKHLYPETVSTNGSDPEGRFKLKILRDTAASSINPFEISCAQYRLHRGNRLYH
ncbi:centrosome-associated protein CEP250-like [Procambarus clarkii]|uniref:centrosome-associated protein CEP250-like n=1 Tax=Procambarus clarkii TaxID=6728 RepID=UPI003742DB7C